METADQKKHAEDRTSDAPRAGEPAREHGAPSAGNEPVSTDDPVISSGPAYRSNWQKNPDASMVIETSRIREPDQASAPALLMVPVEYKPYPSTRSDAGDGEGQGQKANDKESADQGAKKDESRPTHSHHQGNGRHSSDGGKPAKTPSLTRILLYCGVLSLICGIAGAAGYSYAFGPSKSDDKKASGKNSDSSKGSNSSTGSKAGAGSDASKGPDSSDPDASTSSDESKSAGASAKGAEKLLQAEAAWMTAVKELQKTKAAEEQTRRSEEETKAALNFFRDSLLSSGRPGEGTLAEAFWAGGQGKDVTLRQAVNAAESKVNETFPDRPLAEASVREMLGVAYLTLGEAGRAVKQYERALALRQAMQGINDPDSAACRNQLAIAYRLAKLTAEADRLFDQDPNTPAHAAALAARGSILLSLKQPAEAELKLRESLAIRQKIQPDAWTTFDTKSMLGETLLEQKKPAEAEPLLLSAYGGMSERANTIPTPDKAHLTRALERLVKLYEATGNRDEAMRWRKQLDMAQNARNPAVAPPPQ